MQIPVYSNLILLIISPAKLISIFGIMSIMCTLLQLYASLLPNELYNHFIKFSKIPLEILLEFHLILLLIVPVNFQGKENLSSKLWTI
jgi:hypothetical protein